MYVCAYCLYFVTEVDIHKCLSTLLSTICHVFRLSMGKKVHIYFVSIIICFYLNTLHLPTCQRAIDILRFLEVEETDFTTNDFTFGTSRIQRLLASCLLRLGDVLDRLDRRADALKHYEEALQREISIVDDRRREEEYRKVVGKVFGKDFDDTDADGDGYHDGVINEDCGDGKEVGGREDVSIGMGVGVGYIEGSTATTRATAISMHTNMNTVGGSMSSMGAGRISPSKIEAQETTPILIGGADVVESLDQKVTQCNMENSFNNSDKDDFITLLPCTFLPLELIQAEDEMSESLDRVGGLLIEISPLRWRQAKVIVYMLMKVMV